MEPNEDDFFKDINQLEEWKQSFAKDGFLAIDNILDDEDLIRYHELYEKIMSSQSITTAHRNDLGSHLEQKVKGRENICQIMWPSLYEKFLLHGKLFQRLLYVAKQLLGDDMEFDFDMFINKLPNSNTCTPWHQDESYWPDMPDKRALSFWVALDNATIDNGCMWFVSGSHQEGELRLHRPVKEGHHVRCTDLCTEAEGKPFPLSPGSCTLHHGRTLHYTRGNSTNFQRRAYILNFRPSEMIAWERKHEFDHGKTANKKL